MFTMLIVSMLVFESASGVPIHAEQETFVSGTATEIEGDVPHHRVKRTLGEVAFQLSSFLQFFITAGSQSFQQIGRLGQDLVGENDGGLLALLEGLFVGVEVSGDFVRNLLNALLGTVNTLIGTPSESADEVKKGSKTKGTMTSSVSHPTSTKQTGTRRGSQRRSKESIEALRNSSSIGKRLQAELLELRMAQRKLLAASQVNRKPQTNINTEQKKRKPEAPRNAS